MEINIIDALMGEHGVLHALFGHLESSLAKCEQASEVHLAMRLLEAALASHATLENEILFPALAEKIGPQGPISVMRHEHDEIEGSLRTITDYGELDAARNRAFDIIDLTRGHFLKEEQVLFPMAKQAMSTEELVSLGAQWAEGRQLRG